MHNFKIAIKELIINYGRSMVNQDKLESYIEDALANYPLYKNISINLAKEGILKNLVNINSFNETELKNYVMQIVNKYGTQSDKTEETIKAWAEALGVALPKQSISKTTNLKTSTTIQKKNNQKSANKNRGFFSKLINGDCGLAQTYWFYGFVINLLFNVLLVLFSKTIPDRNLVLITLIISIIWNFLVLIGIWRAAGKYKGPKIWAILARIVVIIGLSILVLIILNLLSFIIRGI